MHCFTVMLEGREDEQHYFVSFDVAAPDQKTAVSIAQDKAVCLGYSIVGVEDVDTQSISALTVSTPQVLKVYGRSFFEPSELGEGVS
ncbi:MAG: hypothetical protein ACOC6C_03020 [Verrucomicrobiota bacterium]